MGSWNQIRRLFPFAMVLLSALFPHSGSATPSRSACIDSIQKKTLRETVEHSWYDYPPAKERLRELKAIPESVPFTPEFANKLIREVTPAHLAKWVDYDPIQFDAFYKKLIQSVDADLVSKSLQKPEDYFMFSIFESDDHWLRFISPETVDQMIRLLSVITKKTQSTEPVLALRHHFERILQSSLKTELITLFTPLVAKSRFLKNMRYFEEFPPAIQDLITKTWGYSIQSKQDDFVANIQLFDVANENNSAIHGCGICEVMPTTFDATIRAKFLDPSSSAGVILRVGWTPIGIIKNDGDRSFLALRNVRNTRGELVLVKGGVYDTDKRISPNRYPTLINLNDLPASVRFFYPLTFMRKGLSEMGTEKFKQFVSTLDALNTQLSPRPRAPRPEIPQYMSDWKAARDKTAHLHSINDRYLILILENDWINVPNPESYFSRLTPQQLVSMLQEKWTMIRNPEQYLELLAYDDFVRLLQNRWPDIKNAEGYLDRLADYDLGKVLANRWGQIKNPEEILARIQDPWLRDLIIRTKTAKGF